MSKLIIALTIATAASASASTYFWQELREEREQRTALQARVTQLEQAREAIATPAIAPQPESPPPQDDAAAQPPSGTKTAEAVRPGVVTSSGGNALFGVGSFTRLGGVDPEMRRRMLESHEQQVRMLQDPEYRELMRAQQKLNIQRQYADLDALVGLSKEESEQVLDVLAEQAIRSMEQRPMFASMDGTPPSEAEIRERQRLFEEQRRRNESELAAVLGSKFGEWQQYQQSGMARSQVTQLRETLSMTGEPLRQDQIKPLVDAIAREQKQLMAPLRSSSQWRPAPTAAPGPPDAATQARMAEEWLERTKQTHERIRAAVSGLLTPTQFEQLERQHERELKMQELNVKQQRARAEAQARGELPADTQNVMISLSP